MSEPLRLRAVLVPRGPAAAFMLTDEQVAALAGGPKTPPVLVTVNGATIQTRVGRMAGENLVGINKAARARLGVEAGDEVDVVITLDTGSRDVAVPDDLAKALAEAELTDAFAKLAPSHRKEYVRWIEEAKKTETRARRIDTALIRIAEGKSR